MNNNKLKLYSIMYPDLDHLEEICQDIVAQYQNDVSTCALFEMTLVPEGDPPADKAKLLCDKYVKFRDRLRELGVGSGILVQATIGHGWVLSEMFPYQRYTNFNDGEQVNTVCPFDEGFREYVFKALATVAAAGPDTIMIDDDFRLIGRSGQGCACPLHMKRFNELAGTDLSREELWAIVNDPAHEKYQEYTDIMVGVQRESLVETAKIMRAGIDSVDPTIPGSFCCVGNNAEFAGEIAQILAGKGNPTVVRINNGNYTALGPRWVCGSFRRAASQIIKLRDTVDVMLAETDTCPQNRYSTGKMHLHTHFTGTILEGAAGAKQWITRLGPFEPESGRAYRQILGSHYGFYEALAAMVPTLHWRGCCVPVRKEAAYSFDSDVFSGKESFAWSESVFECLGLPHYFSGTPGGVVCLEGRGAIDAFTNEEVLGMLAGPMFIASDAALALIKRGMGRYLGVDVREWTGKQPTAERLYINGNRTSVQQKVKELVPTSPDTVWDSEVYHSVDKEHCETLFPGTTIYKNELGGTIFVFSGTPRAKFDLVEAFAFLTYSRKQQLIRMLRMTGEMPVYYPGDENIYFRAADMEDGGLLCALFNIATDPIDQTELVCTRDVQRIQRLMPDGSRAEVSFTRDGERYILDTPTGVMDPAILMLY